MATFFDGVYIDYWNSTANRVYGTLTGDVERSGDTVYLRNLRLALTPTQSSWGTSPFSFTVAGTTTSQTISAPPTTVALNDASISVAPTDTSATVSWSGPEASGSFGITFPARQTAPSGLALSNVSTTATTVTGTVSITDWGSEGDANTRYRNLSVCANQNNDLRRYQRVYGNTLSSAIEVNNSTEYGTMTIEPNTRYYLWYLATNGTLSVSSDWSQTAVTKALPPSVSFSSTDGETATFDYATEADGGFYAKNIQYSLDGGTTWATAVTVNTGAATTGSFTITNLTPGQDYTLNVRIMTTAGATNGETISFSTGSVQGIASINGVGTKITGILASVDGEAVKITKVLGSVNGTATVL